MIHLINDSYSVFTILVPHVHANIRPNWQDESVAATGIGSRLHLMPPKDTAGRNRRIGGKERAQVRSEGNQQFPERGQRGGNQTGLDIGDIADSDAGPVRQFSHGQVGPKPQSSQFPPRLSVHSLVITHLANHKWLRS